MGKVIVDISTSLDGFVAGSNGGPGNAIGDGGADSISGCTTSRAGASVRASRATRPIPTTRS